MHLETQLGRSQLALKAPTVRERRGLQNRKRLVPFTEFLCSNGERMKQPH